MQERLRNWIGWRWSPCSAEIAAGLIARLIARVAGFSLFLDQHIKNLAVQQSEHLTRLFLAVAVHWNVARGLGISYQPSAVAAAV